MQHPLSAPHATFFAGTDPRVLQVDVIFADEHYLIVKRAWGRPEQTICHLSARPCYDPHPFKHALVECAVLVETNMGSAFGVEEDSIVQYCIGLHCFVLPCFVFFVFGLASFCLFARFLVP